MEYSDAKYARQVNSVLHRIGATEEAKKQMIPENMKTIIDEFEFIDPYVQCVLIQSVLNMSLEQFNTIKDEYAEIIRKAKMSDNKWSNQIASMFDSYPDIKFDQDINFSNLNIDDSFPSMFNLSRNAANPNYRTEDVKPPSRNLPAPKSLKIMHEEIEKQNSAKIFYSAPPKRTTSSSSSSSMLQVPNLPPRIKSKDKELHDINDVVSPYFPKSSNDSQKKKSQLSLFQAFNKK
ncbi:hypothetical protein TRFO_12321 [Tritrichomonas foetus]|uniref:Uncharacterized protein n=1 Tax=Tritrichomonas foetus TaxID=1144522 RepID=A0A1J4J5N8_9EUKA|nr:hypothetical protein TRFO_12321 [Tritrichomonas foetus]|eukprot:OHS92765.1 hypothetical protein TRFO_12321 [Tritrichomonas foetus]